MIVPVPIGMSCGALKVSRTQGVLAALIAVEQMVVGAHVVQLGRRPLRRPRTSVLNTALRRGNLVDSRAIGELRPLHVFPLRLEAVAPLVAQRHTVARGGAVRRVRVLFFFFYPSNL